MKKNLGNIDRGLRFVAALAIAALLLTGTLNGTIGWIFGIVAIVLLATGVISFCPLYFLLNISTQKTEASVKMH